METSICSLKPTCFLTNNNPEEQINSEDKFTTIECNRCAQCCIQPVVPVTDSDVRRLCTVLGVSAGQIVRLYNMKEMEYDPNADLWIKFARGFQAMGLRKRKSRCIFLNSKNLCSVYPYRPFTCRTFPYVVEFDDYDKLSKVGLNKILHCSAKRKKKSPLKEVINNTRTELSEDDLYYDKVLEWNSKKAFGSKSDFLNFLGLP